MNGPAPTACGARRQAWSEQSRTLAQCEDSLSSRAPSWPGDTTRACTVEGPGPPSGRCRTSRARPIARSCSRASAHSPPGQPAVLGGQPRSTPGSRRAGCRWTRTGHGPRDRGSPRRAFSFRPSPDRHCVRQLLGLMIPQVTGPGAPSALTGPWVYAGSGGSVSRRDVRAGRRARSTGRRAGRRRTSRTTPGSGELGLPLLDVHREGRRRAPRPSCRGPRCPGRPARDVPDRGLDRGGLAVDALDDPLQHPAVLPEARPEEVAAVVTPEPVDVEDLRQLGGVVVLPTVIQWLK